MESLRLDGSSSSSTSTVSSASSPSPPSSSSSLTSPSISPSSSSFHSTKLQSIYSSDSESLMCSSDEEDIEISLPKRRQNIRTIYLSKYSNNKIKPKYDRKQIYANSNDNIKYGLGVHHSKNDWINGANNDDVNSDSSLMLSDESTSSISIMFGEDFSETNANSSAIDHLKKSSVNGKNDLKLSKFEKKKENRTQLRSSSIGSQSSSLSSSSSNLSIRSLLKDTNTYEPLFPFYNCDRDRNANYLSNSNNIPLNPTATRYVIDVVNEYSAKVAKSLFMKFEKECDYDESRRVLVRSKSHIKSILHQFRKIIPHITIPKRSGKFQYHTKHFKLNENNLEQLPELYSRLTQELNTKTKNINDLKRRIRVQKEKYELILAKKRKLEKAIDTKVTDQANGYNDGPNSNFRSISSNEVRLTLNKSKGGSRTEELFNEIESKKKNVDMELGIINIIKKTEKGFEDSSMEAWKDLLNKMPSPYDRFV